MAERAWLVVWRSGDGRRSIDDELTAPDAAAAVSLAVAQVAAGRFGAGAAWEVVAVVDLWAAATVGYHFEGYIGE